MELPEGAPAPRLCHLIKWPDFDGYGFNLHSEKSKSNCQYVGKVDNSSPAQAAGLREGDRIVEVNGVNISTENHRQVVERIKANPQETKLLVVDQEGESWYKNRDWVIRGTQSNVILIKTPVPRPTTTNGLIGHHEEESHEVVLSETPTVPSNFHDLSISDTNPTPVCDPVPNGVHSMNGNIDEESNISKCTQENSVKVNETHEDDAKAEPERVSKSPDKLVPLSPSPVMIGSKSPDLTVPNSPNKANDSINNNNFEEKSKTIPLQKESSLLNEAASSSSRSSTCGSPDHLDHHQQMIVTSIESKMQATNGSPRYDDVNQSSLSPNKSNGMIHVKNGSGGSRGSSVSTGSIPASPTSFKSSESTNVSKEPTSMANLSSGSSSAILSTNGRPPSESDILQMSLQMSVSEMRQMLARKKKNDPKKAQMDLKQKYEIIQQM